MESLGAFQNLGLEKELFGHAGCVNCLEWNPDGSVLASGSDDLRLILWDSFNYRQLYNIATGHTESIFSVKFLGPEILATCSADTTVRVHDLAHHTYMLECTCHKDRVKSLAVSYQMPYIVWSAGEDGFVLQHDLRSPHRCKTNSANVLINLRRHMGRNAEAKCVAVNPRNPSYLAVGANDFYARLYDTRMIRLSLMEDAPPDPRSGLNASRDLDSYIPTSAVAYYAPGHLSTSPINPPYGNMITHLTFSNDGKELLANLGSEQVYVFDINSGRYPTLVKSFITNRENIPDKDDVNYSSPIAFARFYMRKMDEMKALAGRDSVVTDKAWTLKLSAMTMMNKSNYPAAVDLFSTAIAAQPNYAGLHCSRAGALMKRAWAGDIYDAMRDCYKAIECDENHLKSFYRLALSMLDLKKPREAYQCLEYFKERFPCHAQNYAINALGNDIAECLEAMGSSTACSDKPQKNDKQTTSVLEEVLKAQAIDYEDRLVGHCNNSTDIQEASFLGPNANFIGAGSDDGNIFIWCRETGNIIRCLHGDNSIVNCVQMQPGMTYLATSGIEPVIRLWTAKPDDYKESRFVAETDAIAATNQERMKNGLLGPQMLDIAAGGCDDRKQGRRSS